MTMIWNDGFTQQFRKTVLYKTKKMSKSHPVFVDLISVISALIIAYLLSDYSKLKENISIEANLLNNTRFSNQSVVVFNRVPKAGSEMLWTLIDKIQFINKFNSYR